MLEQAAGKRLALLSLSSRCRVDTKPKLMNEGNFQLGKRNQRVALARCLAMEPNLLLPDRPASRAGRGFRKCSTDTLCVPLCDARLR